MTSTQCESHVVQVDDDFDPVKKNLEKQHLVAETSNSRAAFVARVYAVCAVQVLICVATSLVVGFQLDIRSWVLKHFLACFLTSISFFVVSSLTFSCFFRKAPLNKILIIIATLSAATMLSSLTVIFFASGNAVLVLQALVMTLVLFVALSLFAWFSGADFSGWGVGLSIALTTLVTLSVFSAVFGYSNSYWFIVLGIVIFSFFVVYDTQLIKNKLRDDEYLLGGMMLFLDFLNLFINLLRLLRR
jgi:FtsH-binding integral membrane protein